MANLNGDKAKVVELIPKALKEIPNLLDKEIAISMKERLMSLGFD